MRVSSGHVTWVSRPELGTEVARGVFGVEAHLDRRAATAPEWFRAAALAGSLPHHPLDEIDAGDLFRHAMLDLQARVDFEEVELARVRVVEIFDGAGVRIVDDLAERHGRLPAGARAMSCGRFGAGVSSMTF